MEGVHGPEGDVERRRWRGFSGALERGSEDGDRVATSDRNCRVLGQWVPCSGGVGKRIDRSRVYATPFILGAPALKTTYAR